MSEQNEALKKDVNDLLNQIALKLDGVKPYTPEWDENDWETQRALRQGLEKSEVWDEAKGDYDEVVHEDANEVYLGCVKAYVTRILKNPDSSLAIENEYHTSRCYPEFDDEGRL